MADDWKSWNFRQRVVAQLEDLIRQTPPGNHRNAHDLELQVFQRATKKDEYLQYIGRIAMHMREMIQNSNPQSNNPHLAEVLTRHPGSVPMSGPGGQMAGPGGQVVSGPNTTTLMAGQPVNMQGAPRIGQPMPPNMPNQAADMANWTTNNRPRLNEMQMPGVNKKQTVMTMNQISQSGKMSQIQMTIGGQSGSTTQIGPVPGQIISGVGRGAGTMQPRVPSPGFPRQGTPTPTSASPAPPLSAPNSQPSPAFVSPSPSSSMVPSPAGASNSGGMGRGTSHMGAPSPGGMINTPGQSQQPSPAAQSISNSQVEDAAYREKVRQLSKYVVPLRRMIQRIGNEDAEKSKKMKQLHDMLQNPTRRMPMETLLKCEIVLEKLEIHRDAETEAPVPPNMETCIANMEETLNTVLKSPCAAHTLHRTISPALSVLLGPTYVTQPAKHSKRDNPLQPPPETPNISDIVQGEVARLNARFRVNLDCQMPPGSDELTLICQLDDPNLPCVPPITLTVPAKYPEKPPRCDLLTVDYETTDFLRNIRESMLVRLQNMPPHCSLTMLLHSWEMSVRQACAPKSCVTSAIANALAVNSAF
ncbi:mediator of RNA polymerase II transcription subunit 15 [Procambarus clarkii]|uniref:mediator of RNA polymerase II transcription subunit 15 n=1 Tax=Procambarus clarkii TaxID=6728 RepID=UPI001E677037|nr:mediator of RNA polymerase II transcription subunit 15-like [Procambarus clarkii]XP_045605677.1 mediator of RNA polymerase II transcription subunit 15-like [Procambarus clarkii]XP_045605678.1 mediator of RNA polymerase II transcription subunit 15-like [Procambarus clarkii]XP_045605679.1 mediator of RNA polymerase II transcription subunit 15-like [Procambarus clarkii]XP_045605681.1 mediator of RNA polymerase II transcription subunit 15-like [Procambarus clarkii]XP_045605682.1 mediator of RNA